MMEDTNANNKRDLALKALLESDEKPHMLLVGNGISQIQSLINIAEPYTVVMYNELQEYEKMRRAMDELLFIDDLINHFREPPPVFPIESFEKMIPFDPLERRKKEKTLEWKNKLKSLYRVKI